MTTYNLLDKYKEIAHFCTSRKGGVSMGNYASFNLSPFTGDDSDNFNDNRTILCQHLGIDPDKLIIPYQTHSTEVRNIDAAFFQLTTHDKSAYLNGIDAIVTNIPGICIGITTADCVPLLFFDPIKKVIGAAHAGWRGTCAKIAENTIKYFIENYGSNPADILATIGPSISHNVYEVGPEIIDNFETAGFDLSLIVTYKNGATFLDLWEANRQLLLKNGIKAESIETAGICTYTEHERFFSARRLGIKSGRMLSGIMLKVNKQF